MNDKIVEAFEILMNAEPTDSNVDLISNFVSKLPEGERGKAVAVYEAWAYPPMPQPTGRARYETNRGSFQPDKSYPVKPLTITPDFGQERPVLLSAAGNTLVRDLNMEIETQQDLYKSYWIVCVSEAGETLYYKARRSAPDLEELINVYGTVVFSGKDPEFIFSYSMKDGYSPIILIGSLLKPSNAFTIPHEEYRIFHREGVQVSAEKIQRIVNTVNVFFGKQTPSLHDRPTYEVYPDFDYVILCADTDGKVVGRVPSHRDPSEKDIDELFKDAAVRGERPQFGVAYCLRERANYKPLVTVGTWSYSDTGVMLPNEKYRVVRYDGPNTQEVDISEIMKRVDRILLSK